VSYSNTTLGLRHAVPVAREAISDYYQLVELRHEQILPAGVSAPRAGQAAAPRCLKRHRVLDGEAAALAARRRGARVRLLCMFLYCVHGGFVLTNYSRWCALHSAVSISTHVCNQF
jgi:hypothetical protein